MNMLLFNSMCLCICACACPLFLITVSMCGLLSAAVSDEEGWEGTSHTTTSYSAHRAFWTLHNREEACMFHHTVREQGSLCTLWWCAHHETHIDISYLGCVYSCKKHLLLNANILCCSCGFDV